MRSVLPGPSPEPDTIGARPAVSVGRAVARVQGTAVVPREDIETEPSPPQRGGRHKRRGAAALPIAAVVAAVLLLGASSALAYTAWGRSGKRPTATCATDGASCRDRAPAAKVRATAPPAAAGASAKPKPVATHETVYSPYVDMGYDPVFDLKASTRNVGVKNYILAFIIAGDGCTPTWGGDISIDDDTMQARVKTFRAAGGDVRISFGGAVGPELAAVCDSPTALAAAYQKVIDAYSLTMIDFDVEGGELSQVTANARRSEAIAILEKNATTAGKTLNVSLTLPVNPSGFTASPVKILNQAANANAKIHVVNIMAMDYGGWAAPNPAGRMGTFAIQGMTNAHATIQSIFGLSSAEAWRRLGVTPLIGINSPATEVFSVSDAAKVMAFAREKHAAFVSMWAITRDQPCPVGVTADADSDSCAGNADSTFAFSRAFLR